MIIVVRIFNSNNNVNCLGRNLRKALLMLESCYVRNGSLAEDVEPVMAGIYIYIYTLTHLYIIYIHTPIYIYISIYIYVYTHKYSE